MAALAVEFVAEKPLWRRIADFPLVALTVALAAVGGTLFLTAQYALPTVVDLLPEPLHAAVIGILLTLAALIAYKLVVRRLGAVPRDDLPFDFRMGDALRGTIIAAVLMSMVVGLAALLGGYRITGWGGSTSLLPILFLAGIQAGVVEELIFRGILFRWLEEFGGSWFALLFSSAFFGFAHLTNDNATLFSSIAIAIEAGVLLGGAYMATRNLWLAAGIHFGWNFVQGYVWDVAVSGNEVDGLVESRATGAELISGGDFGLEASVIALVLATLLGVYFVWFAHQRGEVIRPWWIRRRLARANFNPVPIAQGEDA